MTVTWRFRPVIFSRTAVRSPPIPLRILSETLNCSNALAQRWAASGAPRRSVSNSTRTVVRMPVALRRGCAFDSAARPSSNRGTRHNARQDLLEGIMP